MPAPPTLLCPTPLALLPAAAHHPFLQVMVFGEITTSAKVDYEKVVRDTVRNIGFISDDVGLDADKCKVLVHIEEQSPDIGQGVHGMGTKTLEEVGAGDQGIMFGYATDETPELMPLTHVLATQLGYRLTEVRKDGTLPWLRPDGKTQVRTQGGRGGRRPGPACGPPDWRLASAPAPTAPAARARGRRLRATPAANACRPPARPHPPPRTHPPPSLPSCLR